MQALSNKLAGHNGANVERDCRRFTWWAHLALFLGITTALTSQTAHAGGYMRSGEETGVSVALKRDFRDRVYDKDGTNVPGSGCSPTTSASVYAEYGYSYYTTVFAATSIRHKSCPGEAAFGLGDTEAGIRRRVNPLRDDWVWEGSLIFPTSRLGRQQASDAQALGWNLELHWNPGPNPYDLTRDRTFLESSWGFGTGLHGWTRHLPLEGSAYVLYRHPVRISNWPGDQPGITLTAQLAARTSLARDHVSSNVAVDPHDTFQIFNMTFGFNYYISRFETLRATVQSDFAGKNHSDSSGILISYGRTLPR